MVETELVSDEEYALICDAMDMASSVSLLGNKRNIREVTEPHVPSQKRIKECTGFETQIYPLKKIISGGQTGADMGGLLAAQHLGLETGGTAPVGFVTSKGKNPDLGLLFNLKELSIDSKRKISAANMYVERSKANVDDSNGTVAFRTHSSPGTDKTIGYCMTKSWRYPAKNSITQGDLLSSYKPVLVITDLQIDSSEMIASWIIKHNIKIMNVCGHRDEELATSVKDILINALESI